ncbi:MAG: cobalamin-independent methionine synthase II family protein [Solirubrobacterales bacterium]|nr:cobalamin-independent methionine synthase II family protein [Solirubrobacterales bacterium]
MNPIRAHVVGSMLRPPELLDAREQLRGGGLSAHDFRSLEDRAVDRAIETQEAAGIEVITDGELRRVDFMESLLGAVSGVEEVVSVGAAPVADDSFWHRDDPDYQPKAWVPPAITDKIARTSSLAGEEYSYARAKTTRPVKVTLPSPVCMLSFWSPEHSISAYPNPLDLAQDFAVVLREEISHLAALGCQHIQLDAPELTVLVGDAQGFGPFAAAGFTRESFLDTEINILNGVASVPDVTFSVHLCRGNKENEWHSAGGYEAISRELFPRLDTFDYFLLEFDGERSGGFEPLADVPDDKVVVLGLISTKRTEVEKPEALLRRIDEAARFHPREHLTISTQCGFASILFGNPVGEQAERQKLELVGRVAREAWG